MSERPGEDSRTVEELLRVNRELAAELRALLQGRAVAPRPGPTAAARGLARLEAEHAALAEKLAATERELEETQGHREGLERQNQEMAAEIGKLSARLNAGLLGYLRRLRHRMPSR